MVDSCSETSPCRPRSCAQIVAKTDGVPLFVEELTQMVLESGLLRERADHYELYAPPAAARHPLALQNSLTPASIASLR